MKNKKIWAKVLAAFLCASLVLPASAYAAGTNGDSQIESQAESQVESGTEDVMPTIGEAVPTLGAEPAYGPITVGSGKYKASKVRVEMLNPDTGLEVLAINGVSNEDGSELINDDMITKGLGLYVMFDENYEDDEDYYKGKSGKAGDYGARVIFLDENGNEICRDEKSVKVHVDEDWSVARQLPDDQLAWDGVSDLVFKFNPGYGLGMIDYWHWNVDSMEIGAYDQAARYTLYNGADYALDVNGSITIKSSALKKIANEDKDFGSAEYYYFDTLGQLKSGSQPVFFAFTFTYDRNASVPGEVTTPVKEVTLPAEKTDVPADEMASLVEQNKEADIVIHNPNGVDFTFAKGTMKLIDGKTSYDFGTTLITDAKNSGVTGISEDEFAFRINFNYSGELPGEAKVSISLGKDSKWVGKTLFYSLTESGKIKKQISKNVVDKNGVYTVEQNHCSDYVATTKDMTQQIGQMPKTGDTSALFLFMALVIVSGAAVFGVWGVKRRLK